MNAFKWRIPDRPDMLRHDEVIATLDRAAGRHPRTTFIACQYQDRLLYGDNARRIVGPKRNH